MTTTSGLRMGLRIAAASLAIVASGPVSRAWASGSCSGTYAATVLGSLPARPVIGLLVADDSPRNLDLAEQFKAGMRSAGARVTGAPTAQLRLFATTIGGFGDAAPAASPGSSFGWIGGGIDRQRPGQTPLRDSPQGGPMTLQMRAELRAPPAGPVVWVATLLCSIRGDDERELAYDIGTVIGGAIGRRVERTAF